MIKIVSLIKIIFDFLEIFSEIFLIQIFYF